MNKIDGQQLKSMIVSGSANLSNNRKMVDDLNVFPVPDGDTGINMTMTFAAAVSALEKSDAETATEVADVVANATIRGARGNSGVILSQLFRGISKVLKNKDELSPEDLANAFRVGSETAYKAVMKPTEGTILTVSRIAAERAMEAKDSDDVIAVMEALLSGAKEALDKTPEMLPVLKQAGVVDSGGMGLYKIYEGFMLALQGSPVVKNEADTAEEQPQETSAQSKIDPNDIKFAYCTEFLINNPNKQAKKCKAALTRLGDSLVFVEDDDIIKVHVHTNNPGYALQEALKVGELSNLKIENMKIQHSEILFAQAKTEDSSAADNKQAESEKKEPLPHHDVAFVAVSAGEGMEQLFGDLGVEGIVRGGQSMNPGTDDILDACNYVNADTVFVFPNNKNIIMAAEQVKELTDMNIIVIPTKSIPQGISALLAFDPDASAEENEQAMNEAAGSVKTCSVTFASRTTVFEDKNINIGDILGLEENKLVMVGNNYNDAAFDLVTGSELSGGEVVTLFYGEDVSEQEAQTLCDKLAEKYPECDVVCQYGGQPLYYYIISVE